MNIQVIVCMCMKNRTTTYKDCTYNNIYHVSGECSIQLLLAQRPITIILLMINSYSYSTNDLIFNKFQIFDQDFSRCLASTKDSK